jgi:hypothetical protein
MPGAFFKSLRENYFPFFGAFFSSFFAFLAIANSFLCEHDCEGGGASPARGGGTPSAPAVAHIRVV